MQYQKTPRQSKRQLVQNIFFLVQMIQNREFGVIILYRNMKFYFVMAALLLGVAACDNCNPIDCCNGNGTNDSTLYFTGIALNNFAPAIFSIEETGTNFMKIADNSQMFSPPSFDENIAVLEIPDTSQYRSILLKNIHNSDVIEIAKSDKQTFGSPVISSTGTRVAYCSANELYMWVYDKLTGSTYLELLSTSYLNSISLPAFSDNGKYLAFAEIVSNDLIKMKIIDANHSENIVWSKNFEYKSEKNYQIKWIQNKNVIYFIQNDTTMFKYSIESGESNISFGNSDNLGVISANISSDEKYIAFTNLKNEFWIKSVVDNNFYRLTDDSGNKVFSPMWNNRNDKLTFFESNAYSDGTQLDLFIIDVNFEDNIPKISNKTLIFNNVLNSIWGRSANQ